MVERVKILGQGYGASLNVILVDENDRAIGLEEKMRAHTKGGKLHRAISVYIFNSKGQMMMQRRAKDKYHSGGLWSNTCCTNCYEGESAPQSAHRSLKTEMGFDCNIEEVFKTIYKAELDRGMTEHEYLHVFFGVHEQAPNLNDMEAMDWKWMHLDQLLKDVQTHPNKYTAWLKILLKGELPDRIREFTRSTK